MTFLEAEFIETLMRRAGLRYRKFSPFNIPGGMGQTAASIQLSDPLTVVVLLANYCREAPLDHLRQVPDFTGIQGIHNDDGTVTLF